VIHVPNEYNWTREQLLTDTVKKAQLYLRERPHVGVYVPSVSFLEFTQSHAA